ncbi:hypothetical protein DDB_G0289497 [Dictyostelium discoideum AX4]|uniref:Uncharacterized protein n=1 Tax=Dictyostelium discoideum TaxID=44689 RepID=Q54HF8_DICDI|nr:hypothetical protein DDB_G0289497 [Dictyostelium discoideum AX4]EAL62680.1 hypothetical protein DDB_G0289497 [Dictyostelium discoideum AX4]|eukprot:XP_636179.1 hypothetical protein DDB_G0289497 [Dictyostelium discoideum AX4]
MKSILLLVALIAMLFVSTGQAGFCNIIGPCPTGQCCTSVLFGYCQPLGVLGGPCNTKTDSEHFCGCEKGLKCVDSVCKASS